MSDRCEACGALEGCNCVWPWEGGGVPRDRTPPAEAPKVPSLDFERAMEACEASPNFIFLHGFVDDLNSQLREIVAKAVAEERARSAELVALVREWQEANKEWLWERSVAARAALAAWKAI